MDDLTAPFGEFSQQVDLADIEQFALENLNEHKKGILGKSVPIGNMLSWTKVSLGKYGSKGPSI